MSLTTVFVMVPNARRCPVKVTASTLLRKVLEDACMAAGYEASSHELRSQKKVLDLALPMRLTGLSNNATLELTPVEGGSVGAGPVTVALQLPEARHQVNCSTDDSLWTLVDRVGSSAGIDLTGTSDDGTPSCSYMNRQYRGEAELRARTLQSIGVAPGGRILIRYQRIPLDEARLREIESALKEEASSKAAMEARFEKARAENEERARREAEMEKQIVALQAAEAARLEAEEREREEARVRGETISDTPIPDRLPSPPPPPMAAPSSSDSGWSFDRHSFAPHPMQEVANPRLDALNALLANVNDSLSHPSAASSMLVEAVAERGRVPLVAVADVITSRTQRSRSRSISPEPSHECDRQAVIFSRAQPSEVQDPAQEAELGTEFFELTVDDLKSIQRDRRENVRSQTQRAFLPQSHINEINRKNKIKAYPHVMVRLQLSQDLFIQAAFLPHDQASLVHDFVASILRDGVGFSLAFVNQPIKKGEQKTLVDLELTPTSTVILRVQADVKDESLLRDGAAVRRVTVEEADEISRHWLSANSVYTPYNPLVAAENTVVGPSQGGTKRTSDTSPQTHRRNLPGGSGSGAAPKWLKKK